MEPLTSLPRTPDEDRIAQAPLPSAATLRRRQSLPVQALRFVSLNVKMMRMVRKGH